MEISDKVDINSVEEELSRCKYEGKYMQCNWCSHRKLEEKHINNEKIEYRLYECQRCNRLSINEDIHRNIFRPCVSREFVDNKHYYFIGLNGEIKNWFYEKLYE